MIIKDQARAQAITQAFGNEYSKRIILCTNSGSKSMEEISEMTGISMSTCYRRVRSLIDEGFVRTESTLSTMCGKEHFTSSFSKLAIRLENGSLMVDLDPQAAVQSIEMPLPSQACHS